MPSLMQATKKIPAPRQIDNLQKTLRRWRIEDLRRKMVINNRLVKK